jgi:hypothetical protein
MYGLNNIENFAAKLDSITSFNQVLSALIEKKDLSYSEIQFVCIEITKLKHNGGLVKINADTLIEAQKRLLQCLATVSGGLIPEQMPRHQNQCNEVAFPRFFSVYNSLIAAVILLSIATTPNLSKLLYSEEVCETVVRFVREQLTSLYPHFDASYEFQGQKRTNAEEEELPVLAEDSDRKDMLETEGDQNNVTLKSSVVRKKKKTNLRGDVSYGAYLLLPKFSELLGLLDEIANQSSLVEEQILLEMVNIAVPSFFVEGVSALQLKSLNLLRTVIN